MALLLHDESASLISGALAQSGPSAVNFINGYMDEEVSRKICARINDLGQTCDSEAEISEVVAGMKQAQPSILLACSLGEGFFENTWIPVAHDGIFYTENALEKYLDNRVNTGFELHIGFNSFEGGLLDGYFDPPGMEKPDFDAAYDLIVTLNMINESLQLMNVIFDTSYNDKSYIEKLRADWLKIANGTEYENNVKVGDFNILCIFFNILVENPCERSRNFSSNKC